MTKIAAIIGGALLMAGVALAGTVSSLGATGNPTIGSTLPTAAVTTTVRQEDRGREAELGGRANQAREDVRREDRQARVADDRAHHQRGHDDVGDRGHGGHGGHGGDD